MSQDRNSRRDLGDGSGRTALVDGSVVAGYRLTFLAVGGMSVVYKGEKLGKTVVLKEVQSSNTKDTPALISEKTLLERLNHPGVLNYHSFLCEEGYYYLIVEFVDGEPLTCFLEPDRVASVEQVADWGVQLCDIFEYLHRQQPPIIYRDLKPENVMLIDGRVKLIDFGIARLHKGGERQKDTELLGSSITASPEHYGGAETDARSDIFTLGATIYELLTNGQKKRIGAFSFAPVREVRPEVPKALADALAKSLEFKPENRFATARDFGNALLKAMGKEPRPAEVGTLPEAPAPPPPKKSGGALRLLLLVALLVVLAVGAEPYLRELAAPPKSEFPPSTGVQEASLKGDLFAAGMTAAGPVVFMGEDVGLFQVTSWKEESALERAESIAARLNKLYKTGCLDCGGSNLEPADIRVGRFMETGEVVVFYAHIHGPNAPRHGPDLLATVDAEQAKSIGKADRLVAYYWRDMLRDIIDLSRGFPVQNSALGSELAEAMAKARVELKGEPSVENLRKTLRETTGKQALALRELFLKVPDRKPSFDTFSKVEGYEPLRD